MIDSKSFFVVSGFANPCNTLPGHKPGPVIVTRLGLNGRMTGERVCDHCGDKMRVLQYANTVLRRK